MLDIERKPFLEEDVVGGGREGDEAAIGGAATQSL